MDYTEKEKKRKALNSKISLGIAAGILLMAVLYQVYLYLSYVPLRDYIEGKWANTFESFSIDTKEQIVSILNIGNEPLKREYNIVKEDKWHIILDVMGETFDMTFDKNRPDRKKMMMSKDGNPAEEYVKVLPGEKDPSIHESIIDDPDEKLREMNKLRRQGKIKMEK